MFFLFLFCQPLSLPFGPVLSMPEDHNLAGIVMSPAFDLAGDGESNLEIEGSIITFKKKADEISFFLPNGLKKRETWTGQTKTFHFKKWGGRSLVFQKHQNKWYCRPGYFYAPIDEAGHQFFIHPFLRSIHLKKGKNYENIGRKSFLMEDKFYKLEVDFDNRMIHFLATEIPPMEKGESIPLDFNSFSPGANEPFLICFSPPTCRGSKASKTSLNKLAGDHNLKMVAIAKSLEEFSTYQRWSFPGEVEVVPNGRALFQVKSLPVFFLVRGGVIVDRIEGGSEQILPRIQAQISKTDP